MPTKRYRWDCIYDRIKDIPAPVGAEIGVFKGECSGHLLELHEGLTLFMVDLWSASAYAGKGDESATEPYRKIYEGQADENYFAVKGNVELKYRERAKIIKLDSLKASEMYPDKIFDFVFIDADHSEHAVRQDIRAWWPKIKSGGWLMGHDYGGDFKGVKTAVDQLFGDMVELDDDYFWGIRK